MLKLDKVIQTRFLLNGFPVNSFDPKEILQEIFLSTPNIYLWSAEALREFITGTFQMIHEFGQQIKQDLKETGSNAGKDDLKKFGSFSNWTSKAIKFLPKDRERLISFFYNTIMTCEGKGLLSGFGLSNKHQDKIPGNPEKVTICPLPIDLPAKKENIHDD